jgi:hypothetical protein
MLTSLSGGVTVALIGYDSRSPLLVAHLLGDPRAERMKEHRVPDGLPYLECGKDLFTKNATTASLIPNFESMLSPLP